MVKYYGLNRKRFEEDFLYAYAKKRAEILKILPGKHKDFWRRSYDCIYGINGFN